MASANKKSLYDDVSSLNIFGKVLPADLTTSSSEKKEKEKRFILAQRERERELKLQEERRREDENNFRCFEEEFINLSRKRNGPSGRGSLRGVLGLPYIGSARPRGRGFYSSRKEDGSFPFFAREQRVQKDLQSLCSESHFHSNKLQQQFWLGTEEEQEEEKQEEKQEKEKQEEEHLEHQFVESLHDASSMSEIFEDAESSVSSSAQSYNSAEAISALERLSPFNPPPQQPQIRPEAAPRRPRRCRLAAKFQNQVDDMDEEVYEQKTNKQEEEEAVEEAYGVREEYRDPLAVLGSSRKPLAPLKYRLGHRSVGTSFNSLKPSHRVLSNDMLQVQELFYNNNASTANANSFKLDEKDFPAL